MSRLKQQQQQQQRQQHFARRGERGFTLTELLVALTVTVIGLAGLLSLHVTTIKGNSTASRASEAILIAEETVENLRRQAVRDIERTFADIDGSGWTNALPEVSGRNNLKYQPVLSAVALSGAPIAEPNLVRFRLVVYWMDNGAVMPAIGDLESDADHRLEVHFIRTRVEVL